jgi:hypothetical protein
VSHDAWLVQGRLAIHKQYVSVYQMPVDLNTFYLLESKTNKNNFIFTNKRKKERIYNVQSRA